LVNVGSKGDKDKMTISIKVEVVGVKRVEDATINTHLGGGVNGFLYEDGKFVGTSKIGGKYDEVTLHILRDDLPALRVGNVIGQIFAEDFMVRIQDPELLGQLCLGDILTLSK
jgi:hypothetical protein